MIAEDYVNFVTQHAVPKAITLAEVQDATKKDGELQNVIRAVHSRKWKQTILAPYVKVKHEITTTEQGLVLRHNQIIIPKDLRKRTITLAHRGHFGIVKTKQNLRTKVWWPGINKEAEQHVKRCLSCQISGNPDPPPPLKVVPPPDEPWSCIHVDLYGPTPTGEHLIVMLDETTGFPEVEIMHKTTAHETIRMFEHIFARQGLPKSIKSDNGPPFQSNELKEYM